MKVKLMCVLAGIALGCIPSFGQNRKEKIQIETMPTSRQNPETVEMRRADPMESYITYSTTGEPLYKVETGETYEYYKWEGYQWVTDPDFSSPWIEFWNTDLLPYMEIIDGEFRFNQPGIAGYYYTYWTWDDSNTYSEVKDSKGRLTELYINDHKEYSIRYDNLDRLVAINDYNWEGGLNGQTIYEYHLDTDSRTLMEWTRYDSEKGDWVASGWKEIATYQHFNLPDGGYRNLTINHEKYKADTDGNWGEGLNKREATYDNDGDISTVYHYTWADNQWINDMYTVVYPNESEYLTFNNTLFKYYGDGGDVVIPDNLGLTTIGGNAFSENQTIISVTIPTGIKEIGQSAFMNCEKLASVSMPNTVTTIKEEAFFNTKLETVTIPNAVTTIGAGAFSSCETLTSININSTNSAYSSNEGVLYDKSKSLLHTYPGGKEGTFSIPNTVTVINDEAFSGSKLTSVNIPSSVTSIKENAFKNNTKLEAVEIPSSVKTIQNLIFSNCTELKDITVKWSTPLSVPEDIFKGVKTSDVTLHVPAGKESAYKNAAVWKNFNITSSSVNTEHIGQSFLQARLTNGILYIAGLRTGESISVYNINGQLVHKETAKAEKVQISLAATKGVFIVTAGEKTVKVIEN